MWNHILNLCWQVIRTDPAWGCQLQYVRVRTNNLGRFHFFNNALQPVGHVSARLQHLNLHPWHLSSHWLTFDTAPLSLLTLTTCPAELFMATPSITATQRDRKSMLVSSKCKFWVSHMEQRNHSFQIWHQAQRGSGELWLTQPWIFLGILPNTAGASSDEWTDTLCINFQVGFTVSFLQRKQGPR